MADTDLSRRTRTRKRPPRKVSTLTAEQVQHKRDLDRKAQRALRQRVKARMQDLEADLTRAKADCSVRERSMMEEIHELREENRRLRSCLESIGQFAFNGVVPGQSQPGIGPGSPDGLLAIEEEEEEEEEAVGHDVVEDRPASPLDTGQDPNQMATENHTKTGGQDAEALSSSYHLMDPALRGINLLSQASEVVVGRMPSGEWPLPQGQQDQFHNTTTSPLPDHAHAASTTTLSPPCSTGTNGHQPSTPATIASALPRHSTATCPLDQILLDFISSRRSMVAKGFDMDSVVGPPQPPLQEILHPQSSPHGVHATGRVLAEVLTTFAHVALPEKLAFMFVMYRTMRWQISPIDANYEHMPRWLRPTATQITVPHAAWIDNIPWPRVRDMLIENPDKYPFPVFSELYSRNVSVNWPYGDMDAVSTRGEDVEFNPIFEKHVRKLDNWTVSGPFKDYLPEMIAAIYDRD